MKVLSFKSENIEITASTAADLANYWQRFRARVEDNEQAKEQRKASRYCDYRSTMPGSLKLLLPGEKELQNIGESDSKEWKEEPPVFYETAIYNISIHLTNVETPPTLRHKLKEVTELFTIIQIGGKNSNEWLMSAPLSFVNEPGIFDLTFRYKPDGRAERTDTFSFRVVSPKLDTKDDYSHILAEINAQYNEIIYQYLTLTLQNLQRGGRSNNDVVWLSIFRNIARDYEKWVRYIVNKPHLRQSREVRFDRADRIKRWTPAMEEHYAEVESDGRLEREYFRHEETIHTHNTRENRFVKFTLDRIGKRLALIVETIKAKDERAKEADKVAPSEFAELDGYVSSIRRLSNSKLFRNLRGEPLRSESMVLQKRTGYAQVYKYWLLLQKGIELFEGANAIGVRPIWELYELWCFLKMRQMVAEILGLHFDNPNEITETPMPMIKPFEDNNQEHIVEYFCDDGSKARLHYQHTYNRKTGEVHTATTENRPDIVLTIIKPDGFELTYLFDAKYRLLDDNKLNKEDREELPAEGADLPPYDAINQMHRYRDAIYYGSDRQTHSAKEIIGGYILFPGRGKNDSVRKRFFFKSIETVNIGAFPLLPDASDPSNEGSLLYEFLKKILTAPHIADHLESSIPQKGLEYHEFNRPAPTDLVLVGYYRPDQLDLIKTNHLYYVRTGTSDGAIEPIYGFEKTKYILLHNGDQRFLFKTSGKGPKIYSKQELEEMGFSPSSGNYYLGFEIKNLNPVPDINPHLYQLERKGKYSSTPYFTTIDKFIN